MNWASARSRRASGPLSTTNRAPASAAAVSKSMRPRASPISKCCLGAKAKVGGVPCLATSLFDVSSAPSGTSGSGRLGSTDSISVRRPPSRRSSSSPAWIADLRAWTSPLSFSARDASFLASASPISFDVAFRRACASWSFCTSSRRFWSRLRISAACGFNPRRESPLSNASGFSRIERMSCMPVVRPSDSPGRV